MADQINIGTLQADLDLNTTRLERGSANAENALYQIRKELREVTASFNAGMMGAREYADRMGYLRNAQQSLQQAMASANNAVGAQAATLNGLYGAYNRAAGTSGGGGAAGLSAAQRQLQQQSRMAALALMQLGYMADDIQYGFRSIVNNIGPLTYALSTAAGASVTMGFNLAAAAQIGAVAVYQIYTQWDRLMGVMGVPVVRTEAEDMEELGKQTSRTAEETVKLNKYKKEQAEIARLLTEQTKDQKDRKKDTEAAIVETGDDKASGMEKVVAGIVAARRKSGTGEHANDFERGELRRVDEEQAKKKGGPVELKGQDWVNAMKKFNIDKEVKDLDKTIEAMNKNIAHEILSGNDSTRMEKERDETVARRDQLKAESDELNRGFVENQKNQDAGFNAEREAIKDKMNERINAADADRATQLAHDATNDPEKLRELIALVSANHQAFPPGLQKDLEDQLPENRKAQEKIERVGAANAEQIKRKIILDKHHEAERKKGVERAAHGLSRGEGLRRGLRGPLTEKDTQGMLEKVTSKKDAADVAKDVAKEANKEVAAKIQAHALENGITFEAARKELLAEEDKKAEDKAAKKANDIAPGIGRSATNAVAGAMVSGDPRQMELVRRSIASAIHASDMRDHKQDMTKEDVDDATKGIIEKAKQTIGEKMATDQGNMPKHKQPEKSEQFKASDLATKIQSGVGVGMKDEQKKTNNYLDQAVRYLNQMANQNGGNPFAVN
jgi:hypothetical protein